MKRFVTLFSSSRFFTFSKTLYRKVRSETRLNGETPLNIRIFSNSVKNEENWNLLKENPVSNQIQPKKQPGLYMVRNSNNDKRYYGESANVSGRLASHKSLLIRQIHPNLRLQQDWNLYGGEIFEFVVLYMGPAWEKKEDRLIKETLLILADRSVCYNYLEGNLKPTEQNPFWGRTHSEETKKKIGDSMRGIPKDILGRRLKIDGIVYPSIAEASRQTGHSRKYLRKRLNDPMDLGCMEF